MKTHVCCFINRSKNINIGRVHNSKTKYHYFVLYLFNYFYFFSQEEIQSRLLYKIVVSFFDLMVFLLQKNK